MGQNNQPLSGRWDNGIATNTGIEYANDGQEMWDKRFKLHKNIIFIFSGHILGTGIGHRDTKGVNGNMVYQFAANYQTGVDGSVNGGNGYLRIVDVDPEKHMLKIQTYSPTLNQYNTAAGQTFYYNNIQFIKDAPSGVENPTSEAIKIKLVGRNLSIINKNDNSLNVTIYNLQGLKIIEKSGNEINNIVLPSPGCYIINASDNKEKGQLRKKITVE